MFLLNAEKVSLTASMPDSDRWCYIFGHFGPNMGRINVLFFSVQWRPKPPSYTDQWGYIDFKLVCKSLQASNVTGLFHDIWPYLQELFYPIYSFFWTWFQHPNLELTGQISFAAPELLWRSSGWTSGIMGWSNDLYIYIITHEIVQTSKECSDVVFILFLCLCTKTY